MPLSFVETLRTVSQALLVPHAVKELTALARKVCPQSRARVVFVLSFHLRDCLMRFFTPFKSLRASSAWFFHIFFGCQLLASAVRLLGGQGSEVQDTNHERR